MVADAGRKEHEGIYCLSSYVVYHGQHYRDRIERRHFGQDSDELGHLRVSDSFLWSIAVGGLKYCPVGRPRRAAIILYFGHGGSHGSVGNAHEPAAVNQGCL